MSLIPDLLRPAETATITQVAISTRAATPLGGILRATHSTSLLDRDSGLLALALLTARQEALQFVRQPAVLLLQLAQLNLPVRTAGGVELGEEGSRSVRGGDAAVAGG